MDYAISTLNKRYRLDTKIGEGGFASVFLATDLELGRSVAIKLLGQNWAKDKDLLTRFRNEARAVAALDHPNILPIYDYGVAKGAPYLVMPYLSGGTLAARMKRERLTLDEIGFYLDQVGSALDYAHQHGIIHRDVKPANLLIRSDGQLVLMDFGLAKLLDNVFLEVSTLVLGTVAYMAPEQCLGMVSAASDIYMLGVVLYQMLAGKLPYEGNTTQIMVGHVHAVLASLADQPSMQAIPRTVVVALDQVLMKVLAKAPADRYPTCKALSSAYLNALRADPKRAARYNDRDKPINVVDIVGTIVDKKQNILPTPSAEGAEASSAPSVSPAKPTDLAHPAYQYATQNEPPVAPRSIDGAPSPVSPLKPTNPAYQTYRESTPGSSPHHSSRSAFNPSGGPPTPATPSPTYPTDRVSTPPVAPLSAARGSGASINPNLEGGVDATIVTPNPSNRNKKMLKPPRLIVTTEPDKGFKAAFELTGDTITLGRAMDNNIYLPLAIISRYHADLKRINSGPQELSYKIVQRKSINPLYFHGKEVTEKILEDGDTFEIGQRGFAEYVVKLTYRAAEYDQA